MCGVKSIKQLGADLAGQHGTTAEYAQKVLTLYFRQLEASHTVGWCQRMRALNPIETPTKGQSIIIGAVAYYPEHLTLGTVLALKDAS